MEAITEKIPQVIYAEEKYIGSFHQALDQVAREKIYIEMVEALPLKQVHEFQMKLIHANLPSYYGIYDEQVVGWADISQSVNPRYAHRGFLGIGILKEFRGQGLGTRLLSAALAHAKRVGFEKVELEVYATNLPARKLYKKLGFQEIGYKKHSRKLEGVYFDNVLMDLFL